ncbi:MAG TPA: IS256 family transposase, partial [Acidimicrobiales bacterium]|nr:IS256 family transposase [Acidimicrobiales bacterium]
MNKKVPVVTVAEPEEAARLAGLSLEATVALADVAGAVKEGLLGFCADVGLVVMRQLMDAELTSRIGPKHAKLAERTGNWHGTTTGPVVLGGRRVSVERPRGRSVEGKELELDTWAVFGSEDLLSQLVVERMLAGVATRRHADV